MASQLRQGLAALERTLRSLGSLPRVRQQPAVEALLAQLQPALARNLATWSVQPPAAQSLIGQHLWQHVAAPSPACLKSFASSALPEPHGDPGHDRIVAEAALLPESATDLGNIPEAELRHFPPKQLGPPVQRRQRQPRPQPTHSFKVEATYVGSRINVYDLLARPEFASHYKRVHKGTVVVGLGGAHVPECSEAEGMPLQPYLVATSYGSAVFFGVAPEDKERWLGVLRGVAADPVAAEKLYNEEYSVAVSPELPQWSQLEPECIRLQALDLRNIQVIAQVLAQSVALDFYSSHVERTLETFCSMNLEMAESANIAKINKQHLLQLVAENNIVMTEIISKLGVHERYDIAWKHVQYGRIWEFLRTELEMDPRFKILDMKLNLIQDNLKYFLEILQARKSDALEWTIIALIGVEICLSLYELASKLA